jgi:hypothetical protein
MRSFIGFLAVVGVVGIACSSSSNNGAAGPGSGNGMFVDNCTSTGAPQTCTGTAQFDSCIMGACDTQIQAALGPSYASGTFTGPCASYLNCFKGCPCNANYPACRTACGQQMTAACQAPGLALNNCMSAAPCTDPVCTSTGAGGGAGAGGYAGGYGGYAGGLGGYAGGLGGYAGGLGGTAGVGGGTGTYTCAQLSACCARITDPNYVAIKNACTTTVGYAMDAACSAVYTTYLTYCP